MRRKPEPVIRIEPYAAIHHDAVAALVLDIQQQEFGVEATYEGQPDLQDPAAFFRQGAGEFWVALASGEVVGCVGLLDFGGGRGALRKMFVHADWRGARPGIAKRLLDVLIEHARAAGLASIWLDTHESFKAAHRFYEKHGFERVPAERVPADFPAMSDDRFYVIAVRNERTAAPRQG